MKTKSLLVLGLLLAGSWASAQDVQSNLWTLYEATPVVERLTYLQAQKPEALSDAFLLQALQLSDSEGIEQGNDNEKHAKNALAQWLCINLGNRKATAAAVLLGRIPLQYKDPFLRGEAWLALARLGDSRQVPNMIRELAMANTGSLRGHNQEVLASYLLQSLGLLKASDAFRETAVASVGWYSPASQIKDLAHRTLAQLVADPVAQKLLLLKNDDDLGFREALFLDMGVDKDPVLGGKAAEAVLSTLVSYQLLDASEKDAVTRMLKASLQAALAAPQPPAGLETPLKALLGQKKADLTLKVTAIRVLAKIADTASLDILVTLLGDFNLKQKQSVITAEETQLVRELITGLGTTKKAAARAVLQDVRFSDYTPAIAAMAVDALSRLEP